MLLEAMDLKLSHHKHYSSRQVNTLDKDLKHKTQFKIRYLNICLILNNIPKYPNNYCQLS